MPVETVSWFVAVSEYCSKVGKDFEEFVRRNLIMTLSSCLGCLCIRDDSAELAAYHASLRSIAQENRDSMGLLAAIFTGRESKARELMSLPWTNINAQYANGNTPLILAVQGNHDRLVRLLLDHPHINVNMRGMDGYTALIRACGETNRPDVVALLTSRADTDVNIATYYGTTALTYAIRLGNEDAVQYLLMRRDIDINFQSRHGENALLEAITFRRYEIARALIGRCEIEVDIMDPRERTPLILAVQYGYASLVRLLLFSGCDPTTEDDHGKNALYYALKRGASHGSREMVEDLMEVLTEPQSLSRICRSVIRRRLRLQVGYGQRLKPLVDKIPKHTLPVALKRFLAYDPPPLACQFRFY